MLVFAINVLGLTTFIKEASFQTGNSQHLYFRPPVYFICNIPGCEIPLI